MLPRGHDPGYDPLCAGWGKLDSEGIMSASLIHMGESAEEHLGAWIDIDDERGFVLIRPNSFRSSIRSEEAFDFYLEIYRSQALRNVILDLRNAYYSDDEAAFRKRAMAFTTAFPRSTIAVLCRDPHESLMRIHREAATAVGHNVCYTANEAEALAFLGAAPASAAGLSGKEMS